MFLCRDHPSHRRELSFHTTGVRCIHWNLDTTNGFYGMTGMALEIVGAMLQLQLLWRFFLDALISSSVHEVWKATRISQFRCFFSIRIKGYFEMRAAFEHGEFEA